MAASTSNSSSTSTNIDKAKKDERFRALKVEVYGNTLKDLQLTMSHLGRTLNTSTLTRYQIFFPRVDVGFYKKLLSLKGELDAVLERVRGASKVSRYQAHLQETEMEKDTEGEKSREGAKRVPKLSVYKPPVAASSNEGGSGTSTTTSGGGGAWVVDPMQDEGYINIRIKPPLNAKGIKVGTHYSHHSLLSLHVIIALTSPPFFALSIHTLIPPSPSLRPFHPLTLTTIIVNREWHYQQMSLSQ